MRTTDQLAGSKSSLSKERHNRAQIDLKFLYLSCLLDAKHSTNRKAVRSYVIQRQHLREYVATAARRAKHVTLANTESDDLDPARHAE